MPPLKAGADMQWPTGCLVRPAPFQNRSDFQAENALYLRIEAFFRRRLGVPAVLMPSGRSALAAVFEYLKLTRGDSVFAPRWTSSCVWSVIGRLANPTIALRPGTACVLAVHKWGYRHRAAVPRGAEIIEDSVDSSFTDGRDLFPTGGRFEIISLPKVLGSYSGGLVLCEDPGFRSFALEGRRLGRALGRQLSELKHRRYTGRLRSAALLEALEPENRALDVNALRHIDACMPNLDRNCAVLESRLEKVRQSLGDLGFGPTRGRLPAVVPLRASDFSGQEAGLQLRHFNFTRKLQNDRFEKCWLLPLHFGVSDAYFDRALKEVRVRG